MKKKTKEKGRNGNREQNLVVISLVLSGKGNSNQPLFSTLTLSLTGQRQKIVSNPTLIRPNG
jgi:hypothetical protein